MTSLSERLQHIGLTSNQAFVYLTLFRAGGSKAGELIKKTGLHRNLVYLALQELSDKKLVMVSRVKGVAVYRTLAPSRLLIDAQEKERVAKGIIEELAIQSKKPNTQEVVVYEGIDEFRRHALHSYSVARPGSLMRYLGTSPAWHTAVGGALEKELNRIQREKRLKMRGIAKSSFPELTELLRDAKGLSEVRFNELISSDANNVEILDDRICIQSFVEPCLVVEVINKKVAKNYQNYFDFLWKSSKH